MARDSADRSVAVWRRECGLVRATPGPWSWLGDAQFVAALLAALPVWALLGATLGTRMQAPAGWAAWLSLVALQPVAEELAFRGVLQGRLLTWTDGRRTGPLTLANLATTAMFVAWHVAAQPLGWALAVAIPSLVFGHLRERFGSVWPGLMVHIVYNAGFGLTAWWMQH
jgi:membrane protease YdiL (CAAX protease family)